MPRFDEIKGELNSDAPRFDDIEEAPPPRSLLQRAGDAAVEGARAVGSKVKDLATRGVPDVINIPVPRREQFSSDENFIRAMALHPEVVRSATEGWRQGMAAHEAGNVIAGARGLDITGLGEKIMQPGRSERKALEQASAENPVTEALTGFAVPMPETAAQRIGLMAGAGLIKNGSRGALEQGAGAAAMEALFHGGGKLLGHFFAARKPEVFAKQMEATLGPEGPVFAKDLEELAAQSARTQVSSEGTVPSFEVGGQTVSGPIPGQPTRVARPGVRGEEVTSIRTPRGERETMVSERPVMRDESTRPGARVQREELLRESPDTAIMEPAGDTAVGRRGVESDTVNRRPAINPNERMQRKAQRLATERPAGSTFVGPVTPAEREAAMYEAGRTVVGARSPAEEIAQVEAFANARKPSRPQDIKNGQYPGDAMSAGHTLVGVLEPSGVGPAPERGGTVSLRVQRPEFQKALDELGTADTLVKYVRRDVNAPEGWQDPEATHIRAGEVPGRESYIAGGSGGKPINPQSAPTPQPPVEPGPLTPQDVPDEWNAFAAQLKAQRDKDFSVAESIKKQLFLPENRADEETAAAIRSFRGARAMREAGLALSDQLEASLKHLSPEERKSVQSIVTGIRDKRLGASAVSKLPQGFRELFKNITKENEQMMLQLARGGYFEPGELARMAKSLQSGELHLHRSYQAFLNRKGYDPSVAAMNKASDYIAEQAGIPKSEALVQVEDLVRKLMDSPGANEKLVAAAFRDAGLMKDRKLPPQLRPLFGVINDPAFIVADTAGEQAQLFHLMKATEVMASPAMEGKVWSSTWQQGFDPRRLVLEGASPAANKRAFGELAGKFVKPELYQAMVERASPEAHGFWKQLSNMALSAFSFAKVTASPVTWMRNLLSNSFNLFVSGVPPWRFGNPKYVMAAINALKADAGRTSLLRAGAGEWARMAREDFAIAAGRGTDWGGAKAQQILDRAASGAKNGYLGAVEAVWRKVQDLRQKAGAAYEFADTLPRLIAYMHHVEQGVKLGMPEMAARARASHLVNRYFATGAAVGPGLRKIASSGGAPFAAWFADNMRVTKNIAADAMKGDLGPLMRTAAFTGGIAGAFALLRRLGGFTDEDVKAGNRALKGSWRDQHAFWDWLPIRGPKGEKYAVSFDGLHPMATFFKQQDGQSLPAAVATNIIRGFGQGGLLTDLGTEAFVTNAGLARPSYVAPLLPGQEGYAMAEKIRQYLWPAMLSQFGAVARKAQLAPELIPMRQYEQPESFGEAMVTHSPVSPFSVFSIEKTGPRTQAGAGAQIKGQVGGLKDAAKRAKKLEPDERQRVIDAVRKRAGELRGR